jgi:hypothetical protein
VTPDTPHHLKKPLENSELIAIYNKITDDYVNDLQLKHNSYFRANEPLFCKAAMMVNTALENIERLEAQEQSVRNNNL